MAESTLKRCPFCGSLATYVWDDVNEVWMAGCTNDKCIVSVNTAMAYGWPFQNEDIETAKREWNRRADAHVTTRNGKHRIKYGRRVPLCECCGYSIGDLRWKFCPSCGAEVTDDE